MTSSSVILYLLILFYAITCLFLILTILLQAGKGSGLSSLGSGAGGSLSDSLGATGAEKTLSKVTSWGAGIFLALSLILTLYGAHLERSGGLVIGPASTVEAPALPASGAPAQAPAGAEKKEGSLPAGKSKDSKPVEKAAPDAKAPASQAPASKAPASAPSGS